MRRLNYIYQTVFPINKYKLLLHAKFKFDNYTMKPTNFPKILVTFCSLILGSTLLAQPCTESNISQNTGNLVSGHTNTGQSFTASCSGDIVSVTVWYNALPTSGSNFNDRVLNIYDGNNCSATLLHTELIPIGNIVIGANVFTLSTPVPIIMGEVNAWEISDIGQNNDAAYGVSFNGGGLYPGGDSWYSCSILSGFDNTFEVNIGLCAPNTGVDVQTACDSLTWIDSMTYTSSIYGPTWTLTNAAGCDSVVTLDLVVINANTGTDVQTACDSYTWIDSMTYTSSTYGPTWTLTNAAGCDSVVTLDLVVVNSNTGTDVQTACDSYMWIDSMTYTSSTNSPTWTLTNAAGCDSVVTLNLTINSVDASATQTDDLTMEANTSGAIYQWLNCDSSYAMINGATNQSYTAYQNGLYAVQVSGNGCVDTSNCIAITNVGINEITFGSNFVVYPNPTNGTVHVSLGSEYALINVEVLDIVGKRIASQIFSDVESFEVNIEGVAGQYLLNVTSENEKAHIKILKD